VIGISIGNCLSNCLPVLSGKYSWSSTFLIYINDLPSAIHSSNMFTFADDTKCFMKIVSDLDIQKFPCHQY